MIRRLLLFGASGDLAGRYLLPALAWLHINSRLGDDFRIVGAAVEDWDDQGFQAHAASWLDRAKKQLPEAAREQFVRSLVYRPVDLGDRASVAEAVQAAGGDSEALIAYLALPPGLFGDAIGALGKADLVAGSRIAVEKPFGEDAAGARALNRLLAQAIGSGEEGAIFRVDHVLGMATTQRMLGLRRANPTLDSIWNADAIESIELLWEETLALEGRAGYFDRAGMLKDVVQNHLLQLLCLVAADLPAGVDNEEFRDAKVAVLRAARVVRSRRGRYEAGEIEGRQVTAYASESGVDPERETETFAALELDLDVARWNGTRFILRAGKALGQRRKGVLVHFRAGAELWIGIDGPEDIELRLHPPVGEGEGNFPLAAPEPPLPEPAYARVLFEVLSGASTLSVRGDEAEEAWRVVEPVLGAWSGGEVALEPYPAGSAGP